MKQWTLGPVALGSVLWWMCNVEPVCGQNPAPQTNAKPNNGISVGAPKSFDNRTLTLMIENLNETLRGMSLIDPKAIGTAFGVYQGSQVTEVNRALSIVTAPVPGRTITDKPLASNPSQARDVTTTTTVSERAPSIPQTPESLPTVSMPSSYGNSPGDILSDQVNVMYQIFNLRMLQERALSDRIHSGEGKLRPRLQAVLGFNVTIDPPRDAENAAAIVEVIVRSTQSQEDSGQATKPGEKGKGGLSLVAMMPQEKTYNRAALSNRANSFGASAVTQLFTVGYTERRRGQIFYVFRDHDTTAFERMHSSKEGLLHFGWQFRPVLGKRSVTPGMRQMFAVVALPSADEGDSPKKLYVQVITHWVKYYPGQLTTAEKGNVLWTSHLAQALTAGVANAIPPNLRTTVDDHEVPVYPTLAYQNALGPRISQVEWSFTGEKTMNVGIKGENFYPGTSLVVGDKTYADGSVGMVLKSSQAIDIVGETAGLGTGEGVLVGRYASAIPIRSPRSDLMSGITIETVRVTPALEGLQELTVVLSAKGRDCLTDVLPRGGSGQELEPIIRLQGKLIPRPYFYERSRDDSRLEITARVPVGAGEKVTGVLEVIYPFTGPDYRASFRLIESPFRVTLQDSAEKGSDSNKKTVRTFVIEKLDGEFPVSFNEADYKAAKVQLESTDPAIARSGVAKMEEVTRKSCWFALLKGGAEVKLNMREPNPPQCRGASDSAFQALNSVIARLDLMEDQQPKSNTIALRNPFGGIEFVKLPKDTPEPGEVKINEKQERTVELHDAVWVSVGGESLAGIGGVFAGEVKLESRLADRKGALLEFYLPSVLTTAPANLDITFRDAAGKYLGRTRVIVQCSKCPASAKAGK